MGEQLAETQQQLVFVCQALGGAGDYISDRSVLHRRDQEDALSPLAFSAAAGSSVPGPADSESDMESSCETLKVVEEAVDKGTPGAAADEKFESCAEVPPSSAAVALGTATALLYSSDVDMSAEASPETGAKMEGQIAIEGVSETAAEAIIIERSDSVPPTLPADAMLKTGPVPNPDATEAETAIKPSESAAQDLVAPATVTSRPVCPVSAMSAPENPGTPAVASIPPPEQLKVEDIMLEGEAEEDERAFNGGASSGRSNSSSCSGGGSSSNSYNNSDHSSMAPHETSPSAAVWPSSIARERRGSEAISGLSRLSSMTNMREGTQHQQQHCQEKALDTHQRAESLVQAAEAGGRPQVVAAAGESSDSKQRSSRPLSPSSSPEPRGGMTENEKLPLEIKGGEQQQGRSGAVNGALVMVGEAASGGDEGGRGRSCSTSSSPEPLGVLTGDTVAARPKKEEEHECHQQLGRTRAAAKAGTVTGAAAGNGNGLAERIQSEIDNVADDGNNRDNNSNNDEKDNSSSNSSSTTSAAPVVRTKSSRHERGRSLGLLTALRDTIGNNKMSKKSSTRGKGGRSRSMSPPGRR